MTRLLSLLTLGLLLSSSVACQKRPSEMVKDEQNKKKQEKAEQAKQESSAGTDSSDKAPESTDGTEPTKEARPTGCTIELIQKTVKPHRGAVTRCYRRALSRNKEAAGKLAVEIHIDRRGDASFLGVQQDDFGDEDFTRCVFGVLKPLRYPIPDKENCVVVYPFSFTAAAPK